MHDERSYAKRSVKKSQKSNFWSFYQDSLVHLADTAYSDREKRFLSSTGHEHVSKVHYSWIIICQKSLIVGRVLIRIINYAFSIIMHQNSPELGLVIL